MFIKLKELIAVIECDLHRICRKAISISHTFRILLDN